MISHARRNQMKKVFYLIVAMMLSISATAHQIPFDKGTIKLSFVADNAVRI